MQDVAHMCAPPQIMAAIIPITTFVGLGLEHSVANMFFIPMAMKLGADITVRDFLVRRLPAPHASLYWLAAKYLLQTPSTPAACDTPTWSRAR